jgi:flagellar hook protein FlgE
MSFQQGLSGLNASAKNLDVIGNNIANSSTIGYKGSGAKFADVFANTSAGSSNNAVGIGTAVSSIAQEFTQGNIEVTSNPLDVAINGNGFYRLSNNGAVTYSRNGQFALDKNGYIVTAAGQNLTGYPASPGGVGVTTATPSNLQVSSADLAPLATTSSTLSVGLDPSESSPTVSPININSTLTYNRSTSMSVYDSLGSQHTLSTYYVKTSANNWDTYAALDGTLINGGVKIGSLAFNTSGTMSAAAQAAAKVNLNMPVTTGAANITMSLDMGQSTQFSSGFTTTPPIQDGYAAGKLSGFAIGKDGTITASYTNGQTRAQGQVALSTFVNPQGLQTLGSNQWAETAASGQPATGAPGTGNLGVLQSGALEASNIDMTAELVDMITAQRVYQANAQTIKTQDSVLQTLVNLR